MYFNDDNYQKPFLYAFTLHLVILIALIVHFKFLPRPNPVLQNSVSVIKAVAVTPNQLENQLAKLQSAQQAQLHEQQAQQQAQQQQQQAQIQAQQLAQQKLAQQQAQAAAAKAAQQLAAQQMQEKLAQEKAAELSEQQKVKEEQAKRAAALKEQQIKAKEEQKRLAQQAIQQELQQQEQQTTKAQDKKQQMQAAKLAQQLLQQQLAATDTTPAKSTALSAAAQGQVDKYSALIIQSIGQQWIIPDSSQKNLQGTMQVKLAPGGMVLSVTITKSSGDSAFDRSARAAVFKASPLPVPKDTTLFNQFRMLNLTFQPNGIANSS